MSETLADFVVVGSSPLARLLAGLLSGTHGRRVLHIGQSQSFYRLPRSLELSVAPVTRPESWAMLGEGIGETLKLVGRIAGRGAWSHVDPIFFADTPRAAEALSHMRHMAQSFGIAAEPTAPSLLGPHRTGMTLRDAVRLNRPALEPSMEQWLERMNVRSLVVDTIAIAPDGGATINAGGEVLHARQTILADDEAVISHLPDQQWPDLLRRHAAASILTTPTQPLAASIMLDIHSGTTLLQQPEGGIAAIGLDEMARFLGRLQGILGQQRQIEQAGQTRFTVLATRDGAPTVGRLGETGADVVANMGMAGVFLAPALARWLCGDASPREAAWFGARLVSRTAKGAAVAEFAPLAGSAEA